MLGFLSSSKASKYKLTIFLLAFAYCFVGVLCGYLIFKEYASIISICFVALPASHLFVEMHKKVRENIMDYLIEYLLFFFGVFLGFLIIYIVVPEDILNYIAKEQSKVIVGITMSGKFYNLSTFIEIIKNNLYIFTLCLVFSILYGTCGTIWLSWHASLFAYYVVYYLKENLLLGIIKFFSIIPHALLEFSAYSCAGASALTILLYLLKYNKDYKQSIEFLILGILLLICGALIEVLSA
jgi:uncharacterized membrane protein SpoIIM required for sporulation